MLYILVGEAATEVPAEKRAAVRPAHVTRVERLYAEGRVLLAGPMLAADTGDLRTGGFSGSLIVAEFPSLAEAEAWFAQDPYCVEGIFARTSVRPFVRVFPTDKP